MARIEQTEMTRELLEEFGEAWNRHDADLLMQYMTDDCSYQASFGPELEGRSFVGRDAVRDGIQQFFDRYPDGRFVDSEVWVLSPQRGASVWTFVATVDGDETRVRGCDLFEFDGDKVKRKNAFRKQR